MERRQPDWDGTKYFCSFSGWKPPSKVFAENVTHIEIAPPVSKETNEYNSIVSARLNLKQKMKNKPANFYPSFSREILAIGIFRENKDDMPA
mmetsp:Transcript_10896/g.32274  ORF Transcript_10896/g.32274 Transcript_10896/m.32274 type:complete len:92 (+) Transcript_10896:1104-1379(+)